MEPLREIWKQKLKCAESDYNSFPTHRDYIFKDPIYSYTASDQMVFEGKINEEGKANFKPKFDVGRFVPGMLKAYFKTRVLKKQEILVWIVSLLNFHLMILMWV